MPLFESCNFCGPFRLNPQYPPTKVLNNWRTPDCDRLPKGPLTIKCPPLLIHSSRASTCAGVNVSTSGKNNIARLPKSAADLTLARGITQYFTPVACRRFVILVH